MAWESYGQDADGYGIFAQRYDAAGAPSGTEFQVNTYTPSTRTRRRSAARRPVAS